jgi:ATP-dependent DNA ligase
VKAKDFNAIPSARRRFIEPMYARLVQKLPEGNEWLYEVKLDGYRCLAGRDSTGVTLWSRRGNLFTNQFPHIAQAGERLPPGTLILKSSSYAMAPVDRSLYPAGLRKR